MNAHEPHYIQLTTLGSRTVRIAATPSPFDEAGLTLWFECAHRIWNPSTRTWDPERTAYTLTHDQAHQVVAQISRSLDPTKEADFEPWD